MMIVSGLILSYATAHASISDDLVVAPIAPQTIPDIIDYVAPKFDQNPALIKKITLCESGWKIVDHDNHAGVNVTGIHDSTFNGWLPDYEKDQHETLNIDSSYDQLKMMSWAFSKGYANKWTTYVAYQNGGTYTFYSASLKKTFTVHCK